MKLNQTIYDTQLEDCQCFGMLDACGFCALLKRYAKYVLCYDVKAVMLLGVIDCLY